MIIARHRRGLGPQVCATPHASIGFIGLVSVREIVGSQVARRITTWIALRLVSCPRGCEGRGAVILTWTTCCLGHFHLLPGRPDGEGFDGPDITRSSAHDPRKTGEKYYSNKYERTVCPFICGCMKLCLDFLLKIAHFHFAAGSMLRVRTYVCLDGEFEERSRE